VYLLRAGNDHEAGKPDDARHGTHGESNKHANDNLLHDIPSSNLGFLQRNTHLLAILFRE
jgi:hypothetical protein